MKLPGKKSLILVVLLMIVASCALIKGATPVTINYANWQFLEPGRGAVLQGFFASFMKENPQFKVESVSISNSAYVNALTTQFEAGAGPDVFFVQDAVLAQWINRGYLKQLDDMFDFAAYKDELPPIQKFGQRNGNNFAILYEGFAYGALLYNKAILAKAGVQVPKTTSQLLAASDAVQKATGKTGLIFPTDYSSVGYSCWGASMIWNGFGARVVTNGKFTVNESKFIKAMEFLRKIYQLKSHPAGMPFGLQRQQFVAGDAAFVIDGSYWPSTLKAANPNTFKDLGVAPLPFPAKNVVFETNWYGVNAKLPKEKLEATSALLAYLYSKPTIIKWAIEGGVPGLNSTYKVMSEAYPWFKVYAATVKYGVPGPFEGYEQEAPEIEDMIANALGSCIPGRVPVKEALAKLQADLEKRFAK